MRTKEEKGDMNVREIMSRPIIAEDENALLIEVAKMMAELRVGSVVITSEGKPAGIITERDLALKAILKNKRANEVKAKEIMSFPLVTVDAEVSVDEASEVAAKKHIKRLPVVENGVLVGIVSVRNILTRKPEYVKRFYPRMHLLASGWTLDRLERTLSDCEVYLVEKSVEDFKNALEDVYDELDELVDHYVDDKELKAIFESLDQFYHEVTGNGEGKKEISLEEQRRKLDEILRIFRHTTYFRKQQSISGFAGGSWWGDYRHRVGKELRLPYKRTRP
ncbi:MAG: CBS domain-containing protein [Euryarchaeota archaeon]|nr:CBS domain-containing protein [Euryarchaeota archaeon]